MTHIIFPNRLKQIINDKIVTPLLNHPSTEAWDKEVGTKIINGGFEPLTKNHHRNSLVQQGQADFVNGSAGLTANDLTLLYTYYYFQMHFSSSVAFFYSYRALLIEAFKLSNRVVFVDLGCGPFTSGISLLHFTRVKATVEELKLLQGKLQFEYCGIDNSESMLQMGNTLLSEYESSLNANEFKFLNVKQNPSYEHIPAFINDCNKQTTIVLNCCYFFASQSINVPKLVGAVQEIIDSNPNSRILLFYQNANSELDKLRVNYRNFKGAVKGFRSIKEVEQIPFSFDDQFNSTNYNPFRNIVKAQVLKNY